MKKKSKEEILTQKEQEFEKMAEEIFTRKGGTTKNGSLKGYKGLKKLIPYYTKYKKLCSGFMIAFIISVSVGFLLPIYDAKMLASLASGDFKSTIIFALVSLGIFLVYTFLNWIHNKTYMYLDNKVCYDMRQKIMRSIDSTQMSTLDNVGSSVLIERLEADAGKCSDVLSNIFIQIVNIITAVCFFIYIAFLNIWLFLALLGYVLLMYGINTWQANIFYNVVMKFKRRKEIAQGGYYEQIRGVRDVKCLNIKEQLLTDSGDRFNYVLKKKYAERNKYFNVKLLIYKNVDKLLEVLFIVLGVVLIKNNIVTLTTFLIVYMYRGKATNLTGYIGNVKQFAAEGELAAQRYFEVVEDYPKEEFGNVALSEPIVGDVEFKNVSFSYNADKEVLKNISFNIKPNKITAFVGSSGCGKSTILSLINKLYDVNSGEICIDGVNIKTLTEKSLRDTVGIVTQSPYIFNNTIKNNLLFVKPDATDDEIWDALKRAQIDEYIREQELGLDGKVGENGVKLSGGQKQRLAIARALLKGNKIIAFDEATSALDNKSQGAIVDELAKLKQDHTIIVVAHRLSTIVDADNIIVVDNGQKVAEGTHKELMNSCELYKELYENEEEASNINKVNLDQEN